MRLNVDPQRVEAGLVQLVLTLTEVIRDLLERQALRRMENGTLTPEQVERLSEGLWQLRMKMEELKDFFGLRDEDLQLDLGPLGQLRRRSEGDWPTS